MYHTEYYYIDKLLRSALYGTTEELIKTFVQLNDLDCKTLETMNYRITAIHQVRQILIKRGCSEALAAFSGLCSEEIKTEGFISDNIEKYSFRVLSACLYGNDELLRLLLVHSGNTRDIIRYRYFGNPLYILMLFKKYDIIAEVLEKIKCFCFESPFNGELVIWSLMEMAAVFREERMVKMLMDMFSWDNLRSVIPELALFPDSIEYLAQLFYSYPADEPLSAKLLNSERMCGTKLRLFHRLYGQNEQELIDYYLERLSPVSMLTSDDISCLEIYSSALRDDEVGRIFADEVKIIYRSGKNISVDGYRKLFKGRKLSFDLSAAEASDIRCCTAEELRYLLTHSVDFPVSDGISPLAEVFLSCGSRRIVAQMLSKGIINKDNLGDAAVFLADHKKLEGLDELNKAGF